MKYFQLALIFSVTLITTCLISVTYLDPHHDGIILKPAIDVAYGKMIFRDTFSQYGALTVLIQAFMIKLFGENLIVLRLFTAVIFSLIVLFLWKIWSYILPHWLSTLSCFIWLFTAGFYINSQGYYFYPWPTVYAIFIIILSVYLFIRFNKSKNDNIIYLIIGILTSFNFMIKSNYGIIMLSCVISYYLLIKILVSLNYIKNNENNIKINYFAYGTIASLIIFFLWLIKNNALNDFLIQQIKLGYTFGVENTKINILLAIYRALTYEAYGYIWFILPLSTLIVFITTIINIKKSNSLIKSDFFILIISVFSLGSWLGYYPIHSYYHYHLSSSLMFGIISYYLYNLFKSKYKTINYILIIFIMTLIFSYDIYFRIREGYCMLKQIKVQNRIQYPKFLRGIYCNEKEKIELFYKTIQHEINKNNNKNIINLTGDALYPLFKENNKDVNKLYLYWGNLNFALYSNYFTELNNSIAKKKDIIVSNYINIDEYVPIKCFKNIFHLGDKQINIPIIIMKPGIEKNIISNIDFNMIYELKNGENGNITNIEVILLKHNINITINNIYIDIYNESNLPEFISYFDFKNIISQNTKNSEKLLLLKNSYKDNNGKYVIQKNINNNDKYELLVFFSNYFMNYLVTNNQFFTTDNILIDENENSSANKKIFPIYIHNNKLSNNNIIKMAIKGKFNKEEKKIMILRIFFNDDYYSRVLVKL